MKIISRRMQHESTTYTRVFEFSDMPGAGFAFDCDETGKVLPLKSDAARANYADCLAGESARLRGLQFGIDRSGANRDYMPILCTGHWVTVKIVDMGIQEHVHSWTDPAVGKCDDCGEHVELHNFTNTCDCGADYNSSGQRLADRAQWGEETGESLADILSIV